MGMAISKVGFHPYQFGPTVQGVGVQWFSSEIPPLTGQRILAREPSMTSRQNNGASPPKRKVLIVDDDEATRDLLYAALESPGEFQVFTARDGESGLIAAKSIRPDVIVLDVMMPGVDGLEVCRRLKQAPETSATRVVFVSACAEPKDRQAGFDAGADEYLTKPFFAATLRATVVGMMAKARTGSASGHVRP